MKDKCGNCLHVFEQARGMGWNERLPKIFCRNCGMVITL